MREGGFRSVESELAMGAGKVHKTSGNVDHDYVDTLTRPSRQSPPFLTRL